eukprot:3310865-Alexandrium_andersonii.AAC.1
MTRNACHKISSARSDDVHYVMRATHIARHGRRNATRNAQRKTRKAARGPRSAQHTEPKAKHATFRAKHARARRNTQHTHNAICCVQPATHSARR